MTRLSVNVNKIAVLRNSRGGHEPDVCTAAATCIAAGAAVLLTLGATNAYLSGAAVMARSLTARSTESIDSSHSRVSTGSRSWDAFTSWGGVTSFMNTILVLKGFPRRCVRIAQAHRPRLGRPA